MIYNFKINKLKFLFCQFIVRNQKKKILTFINQKKNIYFSENKKKIVLCFVFGSILGFINEKNKHKEKLEFIHKLEKLKLYQEFINSENIKNWSIINWNEEKTDSNFKKKCNRMKFNDSDISYYDFLNKSLSISDEFSIPSICFYNEKTQELISFIYVNKKFCGYPFILHGGIAFGLMNDFCEKISYLLLDKKDNFKKKVNVLYIFPILLNQFLILKIKKKNSDPNDNFVLIGELISKKKKLLIKSKFTIDTKI